MISYGNDLSNYRFWRPSLTPLGGHLVGVHRLWDVAGSAGRASLLLKDIQQRIAMGK